MLPYSRICQPTMSLFAACLAVSRVDSGLIHGDNGSRVPQCCDDFNMPRTHDSSAASSLYSEPLVSRASSTTAVLTPDDFRSSRYVHSEGMAPELPPKELKDLDNRSRQSSQVSSYKHSAYPESQRTQAPDRPGLARRRTTKDLIGQYESMSSPDQYTRPGVPMIKQSSLAPPEDHDTPEKKGKRSPIRQSFRNLLSAIGKKGKLVKDFSNLLGTPESPDDGMHVADLLAAPTRPTPLQIPTSRHVSTPSGVACTTPSSLYTGELLYLDWPTSVGALPVWISCNVILHASHMLITWRTSSGNPSTSIITLAECADVRSLTMSDLDAHERELLPDNLGTSDLKPFELRFLGNSKAKEKFAASSVTDRSGWVSAVW